MRNFLLVILTMAIPTLSLAQGGPTETITVRVTGIDVNRGGNLILMVFADDGFPIQHQKALLTKTLKANQKQVTVMFFAPSYNDLAFKVLHDEDSNNKVTKNWTGIWPGEGLGFSNGATMRAIGPPKFRHAMLTRANALTGVNLKIVYPDTTSRR